MAITLDQLKLFASNAPVPTLAAMMEGDALNNALIEFEITTPTRIAAFMAQVAHETGGFRYLTEIWGPTDQQKKYEPPSPLAARLGNINAGDGKRYRGRGLIQITGRANYKMYGERLGLKLETEPELAAKPDVAVRVAGSYWKANGLNGLADKASVDAFYQVTRRINGGLNGVQDRLARWKKAKEVFS